MARLTIILLGIVCAFCVIQLSDAEMSHAKVTKPLGKDELFIRYLDYFDERIRETGNHLREMTSLLRSGRDMMTRCHSVSTVMRSSKSPEEAVRRLKKISFVGFDQAKRNPECNNPNDCLPLGGWFFG